MGNTFAQKMSDARLMSAGIKAHKEELASVSLGEENALELDSIVANLQNLDSKQEKLKSDLKTCTLDIAEETRRLDLRIRDARKRVKLTISQTGWQEFGIAGKK